MRERYDAATDSLKKAIQLKNDAASKLGRDFNETTEESWAKLDEGDRALDTPQESKPGEKKLKDLGKSEPVKPAAKPSTPAAPQAAAPQAAAPAKSDTPKYTEEQVRAAAKARKKDPDAAVANAKKAGYLK
jgi:hypothetical protein